MKLFKSKTTAVALGALLLGSAGTSAYLVRGYLLERQTREAAASFVEQIGNPLQFAWQDGAPAAPGAKGAAVALLESVSFDDCRESADGLAAQLAQAGPAANPQAAAIGDRLALQCAELGFWFARTAYAKLHGEDPATGLPDSLTRTLAGANSNLLALRTRLGNATPDNVAAAESAYVRDLLAKLEKTLGAFDAALKDLAGEAWKVGMRDNRSLSKLQQAALQRSAVHLESLGKLDAPVVRDAGILGATAVDASATNAAIGRVLALRLSILAKAYRSAALLYAAGDVPSPALTNIGFNLIGEQQDLDRALAAAAPGPDGSAANTGDASMVAVVRQIVDAVDSAAAGQQREKAELNLAALVGETNNLVFLSQVDEDEETVAERARLRRFDGPVDNLQLANYLRSLETEGSTLAQAQKALSQVFGVPRVTAVTPAADGRSLNIRIATAGGMALQGNLPSSPDRIAADKGALQKSEPVILLRLQDAQLSLVGVAMQGKRLAFAKMQVRAPVSFDQRTAQEWHARREKQDAEDQRVAQKLQEQQDQEAAARSAAREKSMAKDPVVLKANFYIAHLRTLPQCVARAQMLYNLASSSQPEYVRERQVEAMWDKMPEICVL
jgi:hypothetical protein